MREFWLTRVFHAPGIDGNLTGIVLGPTLGEREQYQAVATELGLPDTAFVDLREEPPPLLLSFSAKEELGFCTQSLLAAVAVGALRGERGRTTDLRTRAATVTVTAGADDVWWVSAEPERAVLLDDPKAPLEALGLDRRLLVGPLSVTGLGRRRLYCPIGSPEALDAVVLSPEGVLAVCSQHGLNGVCLFSVRSADRVASRVFTTSLGGSEAAATGGAALGLLSCGSLLDLGLSETIRVEQGQTGSQLRGCLFARRQGETAQLGGHVKALCRGTLIHQID